MVLHLGETYKTYSHFVHVLIIANGYHLFIIHTMDQYPQGLSQSGRPMIPSVIALPYYGEESE